MGVLYVAFLLICGFIFTNMHLPARIRQKRSTGWDSYFHVAMWGLWFVIGGMIVGVSGYFVLFVSETLLNLPSYFISYEKFELVKDFSEANYFDFRADILVVGLASIAFSVSAGLYSRKKMKDKAERLKTMERIARSDLMEKVFFDAMRKKMLVLVSLSSRKVYVGMPMSTRIEHGDFEHVEMIPIMSGYRDTETLIFKEVHSYISHYRDNKITHKSEPLSLYDFRTVIPASQVESVSLFDPTTFDKFQSVLEDKSKEQDVDEAA